MKRLFLESLATWKGAAKRQPLLLSGARQVGKTHVLKEFGHREFSTYHYLNFEEKPQLKSIFSGELSAQTLIHELELRLNVRIDLSHDLLILDEIQECPQALTSLKYFSEGLPELAVCAAGSLLGLLLCEGSFPVGNVNRTWLGPLKFQEFLGGIGRERELQAYQQAVSS